MVIVIVMVSVVLTRHISVLNATYICRIYATYFINRGSQRDILKKGKRRGTGPDALFGLLIQDVNNNTRLDRLIISAGVWLVVLV